MSADLKQWFTDNGIRSESSTPFEPWQNGRAEVQIRQPREPPKNRKYTKVYSKVYFYTFEYLRREKYTFEYTFVYFRFFGGSYIQYGITTAILIIMMIVAILLQCGAQAASIGSRKYINATKSLLSAARISPFLS